MTTRAANSFVDLSDGRQTIRFMPERVTAMAEKFDSRPLRVASVLLIAAMEQQGREPGQIRAAADELAGVHSAAELCGAAGGRSAAEGVLGEYEILTTP